MQTASREPEREITEPKRKRDRILWTLIAFVFCLNCLFLSISIGLQLLGGESAWLPVSIHSVLRANYEADALSFRAPAVGIGLIDDYLADEENPDAAGSYATLEANLETPVPTVTEGLSITPSTPRPSVTPVPPGDKGTPNGTLTPTQETPQPGQTASSTPTIFFPPTNQYTPTPTSTGPPRVATRTPTATQGRTPTYTPTLQPSNTYTPRPPTASPTNPPPTLPPPTRTPTRNPYPPPATDPPYP